METKQIIAITAVALLAVLAVSSVVTAVNTSPSSDYEETVYKERCDMLEKLNKNGGNIYLDNGSKFEVKSGSLQIHGHYVNLRLSESSVEIDIEHITYIHIN